MASWAPVSAGGTATSSPSAPAPPPWRPPAPRRVRLPAGQKARWKARLAALSGVAADPGAIPTDVLRHACPTARGRWGNTTVEVYRAGELPAELRAVLGRPDEQIADPKCVWDFPPGMHCFSCCSGWLPGCAGRKRDVLGRAHDMEALGQVAGAPFVNVSFAEDSLTASLWALPLAFRPTAAHRLLVWGFGGVHEDPAAVAAGACRERLEQVALMPPSQHTGNIYHWLGEVLEPLLGLSTQLGLLARGERLTVVPSQFTHGLANGTAEGWWDAVPRRYGVGEWFSGLAAARSRQSLVGACAGKVYVACPSPPCPAHHRLAGSLSAVRRWLRAPQQPLAVPAAGQRRLLLFNNRRPGGTRYITNAEDLERLGQKQGPWDVKLLPMWRLRMAEMEPLFRRCGAFASLHGADIALGVVFMAPHSVIAELWVTELIRKEPVYAELGAVAGMQYVQWLWPAAVMNLMAHWLDPQGSGAHVWLPAQEGAGFKNLCPSTNATLPPALWGELLTGLHALAERPAGALPQ